jgi:alpha-beta hydrolase superfamily lysophospholipase
LLGQVRCPVLILAGEDDAMCPLEVVQELAERLENADVELVVLRETRHAIFRDQPEETARVIREFLRRRSGSTAHGARSPGTGSPPLSDATVSATEPSDK